jgi:speckle-type POZ protein
MAAVYRLPRNSICAPCHEGAKAIVGFLNKMDEREEGGGGGHGSVKPPVKPHSSTTMVTARRFVLFLTTVSDVGYLD